MGMKMRVACCSLIYRKTLKLSKTALGETTIGQAVNLLSNDVNRFDDAVLFIHYLWIGPLETIIVTYFLYVQVGFAAFIGVALLLMCIPLQGLFNNFTLPSIIPSFFSNFQDFFSQNSEIYEHYSSFSDGVNE